MARPVLDEAWLRQQGYALEGDRAIRQVVQPSTPEAQVGQAVTRGIHLHLHLVSEANVREHWAKKHARAKEQRYTAYYALRCTYWPLPVPPYTITLTRIAPRELDDDNLQSSCKATRDGVADWLAGAEGKGNDRLPGVTWLYAQRRGRPREYGAEITIREERADAP